MSKKPIKAVHNHTVLKEGSLLHTAWQKGSAPVLTVVFFLAVCLSSLSTIREITVAALIGLAISGVLCFKTLRDRITLPLLALTLFVVMDGISTFYATSGKFALQEFLKVLFSYCVALTLLSIAPREKTSGERWIATILSGGAAILSLVSIDLLSTHIISNAVLAVLNLFTKDYSALKIVESGTRMLSLVDKPNVYAGIAGIGTLLGLGLTSSENSGWRRSVHLCCLFVNALGFLLAFSMGASAMIALAFVVFLLIESKARRGSLLVLMAETLCFTLLAVVPIAATSLVKWTVMQPIPLACTVLGAALLWLTDRFLGRRLGDKLAKHGTLVLILIAVILVAVLIFAIAAYTITGSTTLAAGKSLERSVYPKGGDYTVSSQVDGAVNVTVTSQNRKDTMMHTYTTLYRGTLAEATFTVPEDSMVVYLTFSAKKGAVLNEVTLQSSNGATSVPLGYRLLPDFIANRLQGLFANQNAIQRTVFFEDGMKLFRRSPVIGLGMGAYENGIRSVQSFAYDTKYAHNHYVQALVETGVVGLFLFLGTLLTAAFALWRARKQEITSPLLPTLCATLVFMAGHSGVEVTFSLYAFLPFAFGVFALISLCAGDSISASWLNQKVRSIVLIVIALLLAAFSFFLVRNMQARAMTSKDDATSADLVMAAAIDPFEWADYALSYVAGIPDEPADFIRIQADYYAECLAELDSNSIPRYLIQYYFKTEQIPEAFAMAEKYVDYVAASSETWQNTFDLIIRYYRDTDEFRIGTMRIMGKMSAWNTANMGTIKLDSETTEFLKKLVS